MRVIIDGYEVEIKAKTSYNKRFNQEDTLNLLNELNLWQYSEAELSERKYQETNTECYNDYAKSVYKRVNELHKFLASYGIYDKYN